MKFDNLKITNFRFLCIVFVPVYMDTQCCFAPRVMQNKKAN